MPRSPPRPRRPPTPRTPPPLPAPSQAMVATAGGGAEEPEPEPEPEQEWVIINDDGFVYKVAAGLYPDAAPSSTHAAAAGPDPEVAALRRRRRVLLRLRDKRLRQLSRWEALASELLAPLPAAPPPASQYPPPASPLPAAAAAAADSASVLHDLLEQADVQAELLKKASQLCHKINALRDEHETAIVDDIAALPVWGNPRELLASLQSPDEHTEPGTSGLDEGNGGFQSLDSQQGKTAIGVASAAVEKVKVIGDKRIQSPPQCKRRFQFGCTGETSCENHAEQGDELPPSLLTENRKRKGAVSPSSSNGVAAQTSNKTKSRKASESSQAKPSGTPGQSKPSGTTRPTTRRMAASTPSPGPTTRRRAAQLLSPRS